MTPGFGDSDNQGEFYNKPQSLHYILDLNGELEEEDNGAFVISVQSGGNWSYRLQENRLQLYYSEYLNHSDAEAFCIKRGGHLMSASTKERQDEAIRVANDKTVWLGGRKGSDGKWHWLDGKTWGYQQTPWHVSDGECILTNPSGHWVSDDCAKDNFYICDIANTMTAHNKTFWLERSFLTSPSFHFWWNHNPAKLTEPRGFKISWKRNNVRLPDHKKFVTKELSGSVTTPGFGAVPTPDHNKREHRFTAVIDVPYNITDVIGDDVFVVDVNVTSTGNDVELLTTNLHYELNNVEMSWKDAQRFCQKRKGHLASVSTPYDWERIQALCADRLPEGKDDDDFLYFWLGGTDGHKEGEWRWTDRSKWAEEHWDQHHPMDHDGDEDYLQMFVSTSTGSKWIAWSNNDTAESICQLPLQMEIRENTRLIFTSKNISSFKFTMISLPNGTLPNCSQSIVNGYELGWGINKLEVKNGKQNIYQYNYWKQEIPASSLPKTFQGQKMELMMNIVREWRKQKISENDMWAVVLEHRWSSGILSQESPCLKGDKVHQLILDIAHDQNLTIWLDGWIPDADLILGTKLLVVILHCPDHLVEAAKLSFFFKTLLTNHSLETVVAATMNSIQPRAGDTIQDFTAVNMWYDRLNQMYNFSIFPIIAALSTNSHLGQLRNLEPPYMTVTNGSAISSSQNKNKKRQQFPGN